MCIGKGDILHQKIKDFIASEHLLSLSVCDDEGVYSASCFYAFDIKNLALIIKSDRDSKHIVFGLKNPSVAIAIASHTKTLSHIKGIQAKALFLCANANQREIYYKNYPFAKVIQGECYALEIVWAKYTDNALLLKDKMIYQR